MTLTAAAGLLELRAFGVVPERIRRGEIGEKGRRDFALVGRGPGELLTGVVMRMGNERWPVTPYLAEVWRKSSSDIVAAAHEAGLRRIEEGGFSLASLGAGVFRTKEVEHPAWLLHHRSLPASVSVAGDPVLLIPTAGSAFLTGSEDRSGLSRIAQLALECIEDTPIDVVSAAPVVWRDGWHPFAWPNHAEARWRDRRSAAELAESVRQLDAAFQRACERVRDQVRAEGLPIRNHLGSATNDEVVLTAWARLAVALGLDDQAAALVREAAADSLAFYDAHAAEIEAAHYPSRHIFRAEHYLSLALSRQGSLVVVSRKSDLVLLAEDASATPAARAANAVITLSGEYENVVDIAEDIIDRMGDFGVDAVDLGDAGEDIELVLFPSERRAEVREAERQIGQLTLLR